MYFKTNEKTECCGCTACVNACPKTCIHMFFDEEGFAFPEIDASKCIHCHLCESICPVEHPNYSNSDAPEAFAVLLKDLEQRKLSSSGGAFYAIASFVLSNGGVVFGATMDEKHHVRHIAIDSEDELYRLRGSKYVQSDLDGVFLLVKQVLRRGQLCYFVGTGCQVAGLKSYLRKDYSNLITSDLVCHGVPSQKLFDLHIDYLEKKYKDKVIDYQFRDNKTWGGCEIVRFYKRKPLVKPSYELSPFLYSFMYGMTLRYSCYECKFAHIPRQGDVTLGDFWGAKEFFPSINDSSGVSLILLNTEKGKFLWDRIKDAFDFSKTTVSNGAKYNGNLMHCSERPSVRDRVYKMIESQGYVAVSKSVFRSSKRFKVRLFYAIKNNRLLYTILPVYRKIKEWKRTKTASV